MVLSTKMKAYLLRKLTKNHSVDFDIKNAKKLIYKVLSSMPIDVVDEDEINIELSESGHGYFPLYRSV